MRTESAGMAQVKHVLTADVMFRQCVYKYVAVIIWTTIKA